MRRLLGTVALLGTLSSAGSAHAGLFGDLFGGILLGGGNVFDPFALAQREAILEQSVADLDVQQDRQAGEAAAVEWERQQVEALDGLLASLSTAGGSATPMMIEELEAGNEEAADGEGGEAKPTAASVLYGPIDPNPAAPRLFGDASGTVEELIVQVAKDTAGYPGVGAAGLSPVQWRCLLQALIWQESRFQIGARSPANAFGLTQIIPGTAQQLGIYPDYYEDPYLQVEGGARYLSEQLQAFDGNVVFALAAYNAGPGAVQKYDGVPPYDETENYVRVIPAKYNEYLGLVGGIDSLGTIDVALLAGAALSMTSDAAMVYAGHTEAMLASAAQRLRSIVTRIRRTGDPQEAMDLNTYARAEVARLTVMWVRLQAAATRPLSAEQVALAATMAAERDYTDFTLEPM